jgi:hypothetical protein
LYITWLRLVKNLTPREEKNAGQNKIVLPITRRAGPEESNKKFAEIINVLFSQKMMLQSGWDVFENKT